MQELFREAKRPVALFVDDEHDLHPKKLTALKRVVELVTEGSDQLAVILIGHPKLRNDLRRPLMQASATAPPYLSLAACATGSATI